MHRPAVSNWERGVHEPTARNLEDIARALGISAKQLRDGAHPSRTDRGGMRERASSDHNARVPVRIPPRAYQLVYEHCQTLEQAGVEEDVIEEARRLMSGETFNTLRKHMADERTEEGWLKDVSAAWAFIRESLRAQGYDL